MDTFVIEGGARLSGRLQVDGSKNAALPLMAASLLADDVLVLRNIPELSDVRSMKALLQQLGKDAPRSKGATKSKAKATAPTKAAVSSKAKGEGDRGGAKGVVSKARGKASKTAPEPRMPQPGQHHAPIHVGKATIYTDLAASSWRCVHADNKRRDVKFSFKKGPKEAWRRCMGWCTEHF